MYSSLWVVWCDPEYVREKVQKILDENYCFWVIFPLIRALTFSNEFFTISNQLQNIWNPDLINDAIKWRRKREKRSWKSQPIVHYCVCFENEKCNWFDEVQCCHQQYKKKFETKRRRSVRLSWINTQHFVPTLNSQK